MDILNWSDTWEKGYKGDHNVVGVGDWAQKPTRCMWGVGGGPFRSLFNYSGGLLNGVA